MMCFISTHPVPHRYLTLEGISSTTMVVLNFGRFDLGDLPPTLSDTVISCAQLFLRMPLLHRQLSQLWCCLLRLGFLSHLVCSSWSYPGLLQRVVIYHHFTEEENDVPKVKWLAQGQPSSVWQSWASSVGFLLSVPTFGTILQYLHILICEIKGTSF